MCLAGWSKAQTQNKCYSDQKYWEMVKQHPEILQYEAQFEQLIANNLKHVVGSVGSKTTISPSDTTLFDIPLVVHVVHDYGAEFLADDDIYEAVKYWAVVFMGANSDTSGVIAPFKKYIGNARIRLHLATIDPSGHPTKGVVRHRSYLTSNADDQAKLEQWPQNKYINVWFIRQFGASAAGAAAYAIYPSSAAMDPASDGVICLYNYLNYDKCVPHELGHVLNLQHVWGNNNSPGTACGDDHVDDTPPTMGHSPSGCTASAIYDATCAGSYLKHYTNISGADSIEDYPDTTNAQNIMDYTYCQEMFTKGQCVRMRTALTSATAGRNNLYSAGNLAATGATAPMPDLPPVAEYSVERALGGGTATDSRCYFLTFNNVGSFVFANRSWNDTITSVKWTFSNGASTPTASSMSSVTNKFSVPGWVTVNQTATSNAGTNTYVNARAVYAADTAVAGGYGYAQNFSTLASVSNWPMFNFFENQYKWNYYTGASADGDNGCVMYRSFDTTAKITATPAGDHDDFYTPAFDLSGITGNFYMNFNTSAARTSGSGLGWGTTIVTDSLEIDATTSGGVRWTKIGGISGSSLSNAGTINTEFKPTSASQWVSRSINIPAAYRTGNTFFRFRYWPGNAGNNFYMDNLHLMPFAAAVNELSLDGSSFGIYPNPASNQFSIVYTAGTEGFARLSIKDLTGRVVYDSKKNCTPGTQVQELLDRSIVPYAGLYLVTLIVDGHVSTQKLVVY